ncbi:MAG: DUF5717 family protein [Defluviitaleaceae bacterium]|nr:DUF5717 family protein [Defluviitaleaceae bacterium]
MTEPMIEIIRQYINYILKKASKEEALKAVTEIFKEYPANIKLFFLYLILNNYSIDSIEYKRIEMHTTPEMLEYLHFLNLSEQEKLEKLEAAFAEGNRSAFLYAHTYELYEVGFDLSEELQLNFLRWAHTHKIKLTKINDKVLKRDLNLFREIYRENPNNQLLKSVCYAQLEAGDYSLAAFFHYKKLSDKQIYDKKLNEALINSAYINKRDDIGLFPIKKYLETLEINEKLPFILHLAITHDENLIKEYNLKPKILEILRTEPVHEYSVLTYALLNLSDQLPPELISYMQKEVIEALFGYEIIAKNKAITSIYISCCEKKEAKQYIINEGSFKITIPKDFTIIGFNDNRIFIDSKYEIKPRVPNKKGLYEYFFSKGFSDSNLLISLAKTLPLHSPLTKEVLIKCLSLRISENFRGELNAKIGFLTKNFSYYKNHLEAVLKEYCDINEEYAEEMFILCIKHKEYELAKTIENIPEETKIKGFEAMLLDSTRVDTDTIYSLVLKGYKSEIFINYLLQTHKVSIDNWLHLEDSRLNEKIIEQAYKQKSLEGQKIFPKYYYDTLKSRLLEEYTNFLLEQVIANDVVLEDEVVKVLEHMHITNDDPSLLVAIGLSHLQRGKQTKILEKCINYVQEKGIYLKQFKDLSPTHLIQHNKRDNVVFPELSIKLPLKHSFFGIYTTTIPVFYGETLKYNFENNPNVTLKISENEPIILNENYEFFYINNALIYLDMLRFDELEKELEKLLKKKTKHFIMRGD